LVYPKFLFKPQQINVAMHYADKYLEELVKAANGEIKLSILIKGVNLVNVISGDIEDSTNIGILQDRIVYISKNQPAAIDVIDAQGLYAVPGYIDPHMHIESSYITPGAFAEAVLPYGTTTVFADPHEIVNACGIPGLKYMIYASKHLPLKIYINIPSCVPPKPEFESSSYELKLRDLSGLIDINSIVGLGEVMDFDGVVNANKRLLSEIVYFLNHEKIIEGHAPLLSGTKLNAYLSAGITSDHQCVQKQEALEKLRRGMYIFIRESSISKNLKEVIKIITEEHVNDSFVSLCTDDITPKDLLDLGHLNNVIKRAIEEGVDPVVVYRLATLNPAIHYNMQNIIGSIAPFRIADVLLLEDVRKPKPKIVIANGKIVAVNGKMIIQIKKVHTPKDILNSINRIKVNAESFKFNLREGNYIANVIQVVEGTSHTKLLKIPVYVNNSGEIVSDYILNKVAVIHRRTGKSSLALVAGFDIVKKGAVATSYSHDTHNIVVVGSDEKSMSVAVNRIIEIQGGFVGVINGRVEAELELPICGILSNKNAGEVYAQQIKVLKVWKDLGSKLGDPSVHLSSLTLSVNPEVRITDKGLLDTISYKFLDPLIPA